MSYNTKNPSIRRIHADIRELEKDPSDQYEARPLEDNLFEWHFTIRGPKETDFAGGYLLNLNFWLFMNSLGFTTVGFCFHRNIPLNLQILYF